MIHHRDCRPLLLLMLVVRLHERHVQRLAWVKMLLLLVLLLEDVCGRVEQRALRACEKGRLLGVA